MGLAGDFGKSVVAETARVLQELDTVISSAEMKWSLGKRYKDEPNVNHYIGNHHDWQINVMDYCGGCVDGGATNAKRGLVVHLTPALATKARDIAIKAAVK